MAMTIQVVSDLHLESPKAYDIFEIVPVAPYLALLGDVGNVVSHQKDYLSFLTKQLHNFRAVFLVPGNHEAYGSNWSNTLAVLRAFEQDVRTDPSLGTFILLDRTTFQLPDTNTVILGCSLFSAVPVESQVAVGAGLNDFYQTTDWDVEMHNEAHQRDLAWLNARVAELESSPSVSHVIVFSHWSPSLDPRAVDPRHAASPITSAFATDLSHEPCFGSGKVTLWAFGHTHFNCNFTVERGAGVGSLRLLANQRGYYFAQAVGYNEKTTIEV